MRLKTFRANTMAEALAQVKRELGASATILHTRTYSQGGVLGFGAKEIVEVTAGVDDQRGKTAKRPRATRPAPRAQPTQPEPSTNAPQASRSGASNMTTGDLIRRTYQVAKAELEQAQSAVPPTAPSEPLLVAPPSPDAEQLAREMEQVKRMVGRMMVQQRQRSRLTRRGSKDSAGEMSDTLFNRYLALLEQEVTEELAEEIIQQVRETLGPNELQDEHAVHAALTEAIAHLVPAEPSAGELTVPDDGRPRTVALIGPTGVGKTTTIAKLAANFRLKHNKRVGLITMDTYRIAAVDQLRTYANIIGVPLHVVVSPDELSGALKQCKGCDAVLIDTAGRSPRDDPRLEELSTFIRTANPHEVHLCLSSTCTQKVMLDAVDRFSRIRADRIIFTKLDEAVSFGVLLNVVRKVRKQLSYLTTGQEVPHEIEPHSPGRLAELVLKGDLAKEEA